MVEFSVPYSVCGVFGCAPCKPCADKGERDGTANQMKLANGHGGLTVAAVRLAESASGSVTGSICSSVAGSACGWLSYGVTQSLFSGAASGSKRDRARDDYPPVYDGLHSFSAIRYKGGRLQGNERQAERISAGGRSQPAEACSLARLVSVLRRLRYLVNNRMVLYSPDAWERL